MTRASEVTIRFTAVGTEATLVELEHSKLERHGGGHEQLRAVFDGPGAWAGILELYAQKVEEQERRPFAESSGDQRPDGIIGLP